MFERSRVPLWAILILFCIVVALHFCFSSFIYKKTIDNEEQEKEIFINDLSENIVGRWSEGSNPKIVPGQSKVNKEYPYSSTLSLEADSIPMEGRQVQISAIGHSEFINDSVFAVLSIEHAEQKIYYRAFPINFNTASSFNYRFEDILPEDLPSGSVLKYYVWNVSHTPFFIDAMKLELR